MSLGRVRVCGGDAKFLNRLRIQTQNGIVSRQIRINRIILNRAYRVGLHFVDIDAVQGYVRLIGARSGDVAFFRYGGLQGKQ